MTWRKPKQQAERLQVNPKLLYAAVRRGELRAGRIGAGRNFLIADEDIDTWLLSTSAAKTSPHLVARGTA